MREQSLAPPLEPVVASDAFRPTASPARALQDLLEESFRESVAYPEPVIRRHHPAVRLATLLVLVASSWAAPVIAVRTIMAR